MMAIGVAEIVRTVIRKAQALRPAVFAVVIIVARQHFWIASVFVDFQNVITVHWILLGLRNHRPNTGIADFGMVINNVV